MSKANLYTYVSETNRKYVESIALKNNRSMSDFVDELVTAHRRKRPVKFEAKTPYVERRAEKSKARKREKLNALK